MQIVNKGVGRKGEGKVGQRVGAGGRKQGGKSLTYGRDYFFGWGGQMEVAVAELLLLLLMVSGVVRGGIPVTAGIGQSLVTKHGQKHWNERDTVLYDVFTQRIQISLFNTFQ